MLGGRPYKFADCLDLCRRMRPDRVRLELLSSEVPREHEPLTQFMAVIEWTFAGCTIRTETVCGSAVAMDAPESYARSAGTANRRLEGFLRQIGELGAQVDRRELRFELTPAETHAAAL